MKWQMWFYAALALGLAVAARGAERELIGDPQFQRGFYLLEPKPGKRVVYGELKGLNGAKPVWDLAQWSSRFPLQAAQEQNTTCSLVYTNQAKTVVVGRAGLAEADLSLAVDAGTEYPQARRVVSEPWVHLLVQQEFAGPPALQPLTALNFRLEARLNRSRLIGTDDYSPTIHAAQFLVYLTVANRNPGSAGYKDCFWFGVPIYDNRDRVVPAYEARDFGDTRLFIFTPSSAEFATRSVHDGEWVTFEKDLLPLIRKGLEHAQKKGFIKTESQLSDFQPLGIFIGWEVPGRFHVDMQIRNLSLKAVTP